MLFKELIKDISRDIYQLNVEQVDFTVDSKKSSLSYIDELSSRKMKPKSIAILFVIYVLKTQSNDALMANCEFGPMEGIEGRC